MAVQVRRSILQSRLPGGVQKVAVPMVRDAHDPVRRVRDPLEIHHRQQMRRHWLHDAEPEAGLALGAALPHGAVGVPGRWRRELQALQQRRALEFDALDCEDDLSPGSRPFGRQLRDARQRSKRLHTDETDMEGPGKFHEVRRAAHFTRELVTDDPMCGFESGDTAVLRPGGDTTPSGERQDLGERSADFCFVAGKASKAGFVEVIFYSDGVVAEVKAQSLAKIGRAEVLSRKHLAKGAAMGFGTLSGTGHCTPWPGASGDAGQGGARRPRRSLSLPGIPAAPRRGGPAEAAGGRGPAVGKAGEIAGRWRGPPREAEETASGCRLAVS